MIDGYVFYSSFREAIMSEPDPMARLEAFEAITDYAILGEEPDHFEHYTAGIIFKMAKPQIDANKQRREAASRGGARKGNRNAVKKQSTVDSENNSKQPTVELENNRWLNSETTDGYGKKQPKEKDKDKDKDKVKGKVKEISAAEYAATYTDNPEMIETLNHFIDHRKRMRKPLDGYSMKLLCNKLDRLATSDGEKIALLNEAIEHGWMSVYRNDEPKRTTLTAINTQATADYYKTAERMILEREHDDIRKGAEAC